MSVPSVFLWHFRNFIDCFIRESLDTHVDLSLNGEGVVRELSNIVAIGGTTAFGSRGRLPRTQI
jgi:hypothetical protein